MADTERHEIDGTTIDHITERVADAVADRLAAFEERMLEAEVGLRDEAGRVRTAIQVIDLLGDDIRRALDERNTDDDLLPRVERIETMLRTVVDTASRPAPAVDLEPVLAALSDLRAAAPDLAPLHAAVAEVVDALAQQIDDSRMSARSTLEAIGMLQQQIGARGEELHPLHARVGELRATVLESRIDVAPLMERIDALANDLAGHRPDATVVPAAIDELRSHIDATRPDLTPVLQHLRTLTEQVERSRTDLTPIEAALGELRAEAPDLQPVIARIDALGAALGDLQPEAPDLQPVIARIDALGAALGDLQPEAPDLQPVVDRIDALGAALPLAVAQGSPDLGPVVEAVVGLRDHFDRSRPDLGPIVGALTAMRAQLLDGFSERLAESTPDLTPVVDAITATSDTLAADLAGTRSAVERALDVLAEHGDARRASDEVLQAAIEQHHTDLSPVLSALEALRAHVTEQAPDLSPLHAALDDVAAHVEATTPDLTVVTAAIADLRTHLDDNRPQLRPLSDAIDGLHEAVQRVGDELHETVRAASPDLTPLRTGLDEVVAALADGITETRRTADRIEQATEAARVDPAVITGAVDAVRLAVEEQIRAAGADAAAVRAALGEVSAALTDTTQSILPIARGVDSLRTDVSTLHPDLGTVLDAVAAARSEIESGRSRTDEVAASLRSIAGTVESMAASDAPDPRLDAVADLGARLEGIERAIEAMRNSEDLRDAETRLTRRVDATGEALRTRIDDQWAIAESLAANVSQLNASLLKASEEPQQLRRDLDRVLEQLAERMGAAMHHLRDEVGRADDEPLALRSSVEAGLDRISGRFQTETTRILAAVASAQEDADSRLRRIDAQVTELRRIVDRVQRDAAFAGGVIDITPESA